MPDGFNESRESEFDTLYMQKLFKIGYDMGLSGNPWKKEFKDE